MSRRLASMISVRFEPEEAARVRDGATRAEKSLSEFVRQAALDRAGLSDAELVQNGLEFVAEFERQFGPIPEEATKRAREFFDATEGQQLRTVMVKDSDGIRLEAVVMTISDDPLQV